MLLHKINVKDGQCVVEDEEYSMDIKTAAHRMQQFMNEGDSWDDAFHKISNRMDLTGKEMIQLEKLFPYRRKGSKDGALSDLFGGLADGLLEVTEKEARDSKTTKDGKIQNIEQLPDSIIIKLLKSFKETKSNSEEYKELLNEASKRNLKNVYDAASPDWYDDLGLDENTKAIIDLFCSKKKIKDHEDLHELAEELGMEPSSLEEKVYSLIQSFFSEGRYMSSDVGNIDSKELKMGDEVELEHTKSPIIARRIALDHLSELPDYYTRLAKMEQK